MAKKPAAPSPTAITTAITIKFGDIELPVIDPHKIQPVSADLITESREFHGIVAVSFGTIIVDGNGSPEASVCSRIRMTLATAANLKSALEKVLALAMPPKVTAH